MERVRTVSAALKLVDVKKEKLRKAFEDLQSHSSSLSSFNLTWPDLDSHFSSLQSSLQTKFHLLHSQSQSQPPQPQSQPPIPIPIQPQPRPSNKPHPNQRQSSSAIVLNDSSNGSSTVKVRPELKLLCEKMDGIGLRNYVAERFAERTAIRAELAEALRHAPDAALLVLDALEGIYAWKSKKGNMKMTCVALLEELMEVKPEIGDKARERARKLAAEWRGKVSLDGDNSLEAFEFLNLVAAFGLADGFRVEDLVDLAVVAARYQHTAELCRVLGFGDWIYDLILKLISKDKPLLAIKFIFEFDLSDKFPPVPILKEYAEESKKLADKVRKDGYYSFQSLNEARTKEVRALKSVIEVIQVHKLESEYPMENLIKRIEKLEKKRFASAPASKPQQQSRPHKLSGSKRSRTTARAGLASIPKSNAAATSASSGFQQSRSQPAGLLPDHPAPYWSSPAGPYGLPDSTSGIAPYEGISSGLYGSAGAPWAIHGNLTATQPYLSSPAGPYGLADPILSVAPYAGSSAGLYGSAGAPSV